MGVLSDARWVVPPLADGDGGGMDRLRRSVSRFSTGREHAHRRAVIEAVLAQVDPSALRTAARRLARADPTPPVVPRVPLTALAQALGADDPAAVAALVPPVAAAYLPGPVAGPISVAAGPGSGAGESGFVTGGSEPGAGGPRPGAGGPRPGAGGPRPGLGDAAGARADVAADELLERVGAARAAVLVQSCLPVAAWVRTALDRGISLDEVLATAPPVPATTRWRDGETVTVPLDGIPFGAGPRRCPGQAHARALAEGVLDAALRPG